MSASTITVNRTRAWVGVGIGAVVLTVLVLTVLNKSWWAKRIRDRWVEGHRYASEFSSSGYEYEFVVPNVENWTLPALIRAYYQGHDGWKLRDQ